MPGHLKKKHRLFHCLGALSCHILDCTCRISNYNRRGINHKDTKRIENTGEKEINMYSINIILSKSK